MRLFQKQFLQRQRRNARNKTETSNKTILFDNVMDSRSIPNKRVGKMIDTISVGGTDDARNRSKTAINRPASGENTTSHSQIPSLYIPSSENPNSSNNHTMFSSEIPTNSNPHDSDDAVIENYEQRIEELGQMMLEQGRCLDELTAQSSRLSSENVLLRERLSAGVESFLTRVNGDRSEGKGENEAPGCESSLTSRNLKNIMTFHNQSKSSIGSSRIFRNDEDESNVVNKYKDKIDLLTQQSELLAKELASANEHIADRDERVVSLGNDLSACLKKARKCE